MNFKFRRDTQLRKLPNGKKNQLINLLENDSAWRKIMSIVTKDPHNRNEYQLRYSFENIRLIETVGLRDRIQCSLLFLEEWEITGTKKERPTLGDLLHFSIQAQVFQLAEFIALNLLEEPPPERPSTGPTARINTDDINTGEVTRINTDDINTGEVTRINTEEVTRIKTDDNTKEVNTFVYDYDTIRKFSDNFKIILGRGGFSEIYLGKMPNGKAIAIKKLFFSDIDENLIKEELIILKKCSHPNLLLLLGYCYQRESCYLIHDYISNGTLEDALKKSSTLNLLWFNRLNIAHGTIKGLKYLHTFFEEPYVHRDVKSANILLERDLTAKLCDFEGLRKISSDSEDFTENVFGTEGYTAPDVDISIKMDSYSFGVVLLELLTGLSAYDISREDFYLISLIEDFEIKDIDKRADWTENLAKSIYELAKKCLEFEKNDRLDSDGILKELEEILRDCNGFHQVAELRCTRGPRVIGGPNAS